MSSDKNKKTMDNKFGANSDPNPDLREDNDSSSAFEFNNMNEKKLKPASASSDTPAVRPGDKSSSKPSPVPASVPSNPTETTTPAVRPGDKSSSKPSSETSSDPSNPTEKATPAVRPGDKSSPKPSPAPASVPSNPTETTTPAVRPGDKSSSKPSSETSSDPSNPTEKATPAVRPGEEPSPKPSPEPAPTPSVTAEKSPSSPSKDDGKSKKTSPRTKFYPGCGGVPISIPESSDETIDDKPSSSSFLNKQEKKTAKHPIYDNKWEIPVDDSSKFDDKPRISYDDLRNEIKERHEELENWLQQLIDNNEMLPMPFRPSSPEHKNDKFIRVAPEDVKGKEVWFLGDIHGDSLSLTAVLQAISDLSKSKNKIIILLGDVFDRLSDYFEVFFQILLLMYKDNNIVWLSGNHDFVTYDESTDKFFSPTKPSEFTEWLNDPNGADGEFRQIARQITKLYSKLIDSLPAALYFPDGLFVSHGGFPHPHWYETAIKKWEDFNDRRFVYDFYWKRVHESKRQAMFSSSKGGELGYEDFDSFCNLLEKRFMSPVSAFLRGHDHFPERVKVFDKYKKPVITINTICNTEDGSDPIGKYGYKTTPVIIKYNPKIPRDYVSYAKLDGIIEKILPIEAEKAEIAEEIKELEAKITKKESEHKAKIVKEQSDHDAIIAEEQKKHEERIAEEKRAFEAKIAEANRIFEAKIAKEQSEQKAKIDEDNRVFNAKIAVEQERLNALKERKAQKDLEVQKTFEELKAGVKTKAGATPKVDEESKGLEE